MSILKIDRLGHAYGRYQVIEEISLEVPSAALWAAPVADAADRVATATRNVLADLGV